MPAKMTLEKFLIRVKMAHGNRFDYSKVQKLDAKIKILCPVHGEFEQGYLQHIRSAGCPFCSGKRNTTKTFVEKSTSVHGNRYDYSLVEYLSSKSPVPIICKTHGIFKQFPANHFNGHGCPKCRAKELSEKFRMTVEVLLERCHEVHGERYSYQIMEQPRKNSEKITIMCREHGPFLQKINVHLLGSGCPKCNMSKGESLISKYFDKHGIPYVYQKSFPTCRNVKPLYFDFYLPVFNACIEFDGDQHFKPYFNGASADYQLLLSKKKDSIKNIWAIENRIPLMRIDTFIKIEEDLNVFIDILRAGVIPNDRIFDQRRRGKDIPYLIKLYEKGASISSLSFLFPYSGKTVKEILHTNGIKIRSRSEQRSLDYIDIPEISGVLKRFKKSYSDQTMRLSRLRNCFYD